MPGSEITVVVPSHRRRLRLRWLLNALEEQSLNADRWDVVVVHDYGAAEARDTIERHPLAADGRLRHVAIDPGTGGPGRQRNLGWRPTTAPLIAFVDDDCRAAPGWLEALLTAARATPGAIVQGATRNEPFEERLFAAPHVRSLHIDPPNAFAQACNILYPRELLEELDGFREDVVSGEDTDLMLRARERGAPYVGAPAAVVFHSVESFGLPGMVRLNRKWADLPAVVARHPDVRGDLAAGVFWRDAHALLMLAAVGAIGARRHAGLALLAVPYLRSKLARRGKGRRARLACALELPGQAIVDAAEIATMVRGSVRHRTLLL